MNSQLSNDLLSAIVTYRTYSKHLPHLSRRETWEEAVNRNMTMHLDRFPKLSKKIMSAFSYVHDRETLGSMRSLQFGGKAMLRNNLRGFNCSFTNVDSPRVFGEILFLLLSGTGVGFSVQRRHISQLPKVQQPVEEGAFVVHDSIEGWAQALDVLMESYFFKRIRPQFDFFQIRPKGSRLVTSGAKAPGPEPLKHMLQVVESKLKIAIGRKLSDIEVHDIVTIISDCVLAGGIRRSALISLFDRDSKEMLASKSGSWWEKHPYRARANNSVVLPRGEVTQEEFNHIFDICKKSKSGEPGFFWTNNLDWGTNPCSPAWSTLLTPNGIKTMGEIKVGDKIWSGKQWTEVVNKTMTGIKKVYAYRTGGGTFYGTENHRVVSDGVKIEVKYAKTIDACNHPNSSVLDKKTYEIQKVDYISEEAVFDITVAADEHTYWTDGLLVSNCGEVSLNASGNGGQLCNLTSVNQTGVKNKQDLINRVKAATVIGTLQASYTDFPFLRPGWKEITDKEALLGVSFTGIADAASIVSPEWINDAVKAALETNESIAKLIGINPAARVTTVKPEGSGSTVVGSSSGIHARWSKNTYLRRIRMVKDDALSKYLMATIPDLCEDSVNEANTIVVTIPQKSPAGCIGREDESALDLLNRVIFYNKNWVHPGHRSGDNRNNVSCTISVKDNEWDLVKDFMWTNREFYSGISLLPYEETSTIYKQLPFETCNEETYTKYMGLVKEIDLRQVLETEDTTSQRENLACASGACLVDG
jgi:hypothetical protein